MRKDKGITIIALVITVIIMLILVTVTTKIGTGQIEKAKLEDLKATMLLIKGRAQIAIDKENFGENYNKEGMVKLTDEATLPEDITNNYDLTNLQTTFNNLADKTKLYIWEQTAMDNNNIDVTITNTEFYVIDYNTREVYYSQGYKSGETTYYSLTDMQNI